MEIVDAVHSGGVRGMYVQGENPAMSDPNLNHARGALSMLDHLVVQDIFLTETAGFCGCNFFLLPLFRKRAAPSQIPTAKYNWDDKPLILPGNARQDWWIIQEVARRLGVDWSYDGPEEIFF